MTEPTPGEIKFWDLAEPFLIRPDISKSCLLYTSDAADE